MIRCQGRSLLPCRCFVFRLSPRRKVTALLLITLFLASDQAGWPAFVSRDDHIIGLWSDACPCQIPCPCWKSGKANASLCVNVQLYAISQAVLNGVATRDLQFVLVAMPTGPHGISIPRRAYVDSGVPGEKVRTMTKLIEMMYGVSVQVIRRKVHISTSSEKHEVTIPGVLTYKSKASQRGRNKGRRLRCSFSLPLAARARARRDGTNGLFFRR